MHHTKIGLLCSIPLLLSSGCDYWKDPEVQKQKERLLEIGCRFLTEDLPRLKQKNCDPLKAAGDTFGYIECIKKHNQVSLALQEKKFEAIREFAKCSKDGINQAFDAIERLVKLVDGGADAFKELRGLLSDASIRLAADIVAVRVPPLTPPNSSTVLELRVDPSSFVAIEWPGVSEFDEHFDLANDIRGHVVLTADAEEDMVTIDLSKFELRLGPFTGSSLETGLEVAVFAGPEPLWCEGQPDSTVYPNGWHVEFDEVVRYAITESSIDDPDPHYPVHLRFDMFLSADLSRLRITTQGMVPATEILPAPEPSDERFWGFQVLDPLIAGESARLELSFGRPGTPYEVYGSTRIVTAFQTFQGVEWDLDRSVQGLIASGSFDSDGHGEAVFVVPADASGEDRFFQALVLGPDRPRSTTTVAARVADPFRRGDANADGDVEIGDVVQLLRGLFLGSPLPCADAADADDDGALAIADAVDLLGFLFLGERTPPPAPGPFTPGADRTPDPSSDTLDLGCANYPR